VRPLPRQRLRLFYRKDEILMYIGHRDLLRFVHRVLRRAQIPYATRGSFSPKPRVTFGPALPLGVMAENEPLDIELRDNVVLDVVQVAGSVSRLIDAAQPRDFVVALSTLKQDVEPLERVLAAAQYRLSYDSEPAAQYELLAGEAPLVIAGPKRTQDVRPLIMSVELFSRDLILTAALSAEGSVNIVKLGALVEEQTGIAPVKLCRECFLCDDGLPL